MDSAGAEPSGQAVDRDIAFVFAAVRASTSAFDRRFTGTSPSRCARTNEKRDVVDRRVREVARALRIDGLLAANGPRPCPAATYATRRHRAGACAPAQGPPYGRADGRTRCQAARGDAGRAQAYSHRERGNHRLRHPRSGRGHGHGRPDRHHERRGPAAGRVAGRRLSISRQPVRGAVRRQPDHERREWSDPPR